MSGVLQTSGVLTVGKIMTNNITSGSVSADNLNVAQNATVANNLTVSNSLSVDHPVFNNVTVNDTLTVANAAVGTLSATTYDHTHEHTHTIHSSFTELDIGSFHLKEDAGLLVIEKEETDGNGVVTSTRLVEISE